MSKELEIPYCDVCLMPIKKISDVYTTECYRRKDLLVCKKCSVDIRNLILKTL